MKKGGIIVMRVGWNGLSMSVYGVVGVVGVVVWLGKERRKKDSTVRSNPGWTNKKATKSRDGKEEGRKE